MDGEQKALLIINMINDFVIEGSPMEVPLAREIIENIAGEIRYAREKSRPIIYICDCHDEDDPEFEYRPKHAIRTTQGAKIIDVLTPLARDHLIEKFGYSGFFRTNLENLLDEMEIDEVLICGVLANVCVLYTALDAVQRGIRAIVPETCVASLDAQSKEFALRQISDLTRWSFGNKQE